MSAERTPDQSQSSVSPQETTIQSQSAEHVGLIRRAMTGVVNILKDIGSGRAQKLSTHGPNPVENPGQTQTSRSEPSQS